MRSSRHLARAARAHPHLVRSRHPQRGAGDARISGGEAVAVWCVSRAPASLLNASTFVGLEIEVGRHVDVRFGAGAGRLHTALCCGPWLRRGGGVWSVHRSRRLGGREWRAAPVSGCLRRACRLQARAVSRAVRCRSIAATRSRSSWRSQRITLVLSRRQLSVGRLTQQLVGATGKRGAGRRRCPVLGSCVLEQRGGGRRLRCAGPGRGIGAARRSPR